VEGIEKPWILSRGEVNKIKTNKKVKNVRAKLFTAFGIMVLILAVPLTALAEDTVDPLRKAHKLLTPRRLKAALRKPEAPAPRNQVFQMILLPEATVKPLP